MGFTNILGEKSGNEAALTEVIKANKDKHPIKLLFPCGNLRLEVLRDSLLEQGKFCVGTKQHCATHVDNIFFFALEIPVEFLESYETSAHPNLVALVRDEIASLVRNECSS